MPDDGPAPASPPPAATPIGFTASHRRVLLALLVLLSGYIAARLALNPTSIGDPQPARPLRESELADRIDPNTADIPTLAALPGLGEKRAADIVRYREEALRANPDRPAFSRPLDLLKIRGIGYAMMTQLTSFLMFPDAPSSPAAPPAASPTPAPAAAAPTSAPASRKIPG